jgi:hypothetical protein
VFVYLFIWLCVDETLTHFPPNRPPTQHNDDYRALETEYYGQEEWSYGEAKVGRLVEGGVVGVNIYASVRVWLIGGQGAI